MAADNIDLLVGFESLLQTHQSLYQQVCTERTRLETQADVYRCLLKPWSSCQAIGDKANSGDKDQQSEKNVQMDKQIEIQHEDKEVALINSVLAKAERARNTHKQVNPEKKDVGEVVGASDKSVKFTVNKNALDSRKDNSQVKNKSGNLSSAQGGRGTTLAKSATVKTNQIGIISQSKFNQITGKTIPGNRSKQSTGLAPVHNKAPFKTEPDKVKVKRPGSRIVQRKATCGSGKDTQCDQQEPALENSKSRGDNPCRDNSVDPMIEAAAAVTRKPDHACDKTYDQTNNVSHGATNKVLTNLVTSCNKDPEQCQSDNRFNLLRDGTKLTVPTRLHRSFIRNHNLRQKVQACKLTVKVDSASQKDRFLQKLDEVVDMNEKSQMGEVVHKHTKLLQALQEELNLLGLQHVSAKLSDRDVLRKRMVLEMILTTYGEVSNVITQLSRGLHPNDPAVCPQQVDLPLPVKPTEELQTSHSSGPLSEVIEYRHEKDIMKYLLYQHNYKILTIQKRIVSDISEVIVPHLEQMSEESQHNAVSVYRCVYALLSQPPGQLPTLVVDSLEDS